MGQFWRLLNLDKSQMESLVKMGETFHEGPLSCIMLSYPPPIKLVPYFKPHPSSPSPVRNKGIHGLPNEIVDEIFGHQEDYVDCIRLALTGRRYWNLARPHIKRAMTANFASLSWAGDRIICVGDGNEVDDLPPALKTGEFTGVDLYFTLQEHFKDAYNFSRPIEGLGRKSLRLKIRGDLMNDFYEHLDKPFPHELSSAHIFMGCIPEDVDDDSLVLRNLSKHEFVRYSELPFDLVPREQWYWSQVDVDLTWAALARICWSTDPGTSMAYDGDMHRGVWAGDRLDIVSVEELQEEGKEGEREREGEVADWKDVSKAVAKELTLILASQFDIALPPSSD
ncbi:hypothetical protein EVG20_g2773 [Dentipellis fragilis]|uniref:F-box domain-containing protein n=1 Tax=Dentipellis fragilis TaxID=205917 RepID=A0A4Y9Z863_9AGAM|nr:hypothetical protein EVG20_g2773 [Dentipellis fragilis]